MAAGYSKWGFAFGAYGYMWGGLEVLWPDANRLLLLQCGNMIRQGNIVKVWVRAVYTEEGRLDAERKLGGKYSNLTDSIALEEIECKKKRHRVLALIVHSMEGKVIISDFRELERDFTVPEAILETFCKH